MISNKQINERPAGQLSFAGILILYQNSIICNEIKNFFMALIRINFQYWTFN